jgi:hypothetical protein
MSRLFTLIILVSLFSLSHPGVSAELPSVPEIPVQNLPDVAISALAANGQPVIYFNPLIISRLDPLVVKFIKAHECGHIVLGHLAMSMYITDPYYHLQMAQQNEIAADRFATDYWMEHDPRVVAAAITWMVDPRTANRGDWTHLPSPQRAQLIIARARELGLSDLNFNSSHFPTQHDEQETDEEFVAFARFADEGVESLRDGKPERDFWESREKFPGATETEIIGMNPGYSLRARFEFDDKPSAAAKCKDLAERATNQLRNGWTSEDRSGHADKVFWMTWDEKNGQAEVGISWHEKDDGTAEVDVDFEKQDLSN